MLVLREQLTEDKITIGLRTSRDRNSQTRLPTDEEAREERKEEQRGQEDKVTVGLTASSYVRNTIIIQYIQVHSNTTRTRKEEEQEA